MPLLRARASLDADTQGESLTHIHGNSALRVPARAPELAMIIQPG